MNLCLMIEGQEDVTWPQWVALARACEDLAIRRFLPAAKRQALPNEFVSLNVACGAAFEYLNNQT